MIVFQENKQVNYMNLKDVLKMQLSISNEI